MQDFLQWVESRSNIRVVSFNKTGEITFEINGRTYTYIMDSGYFYNGFFPKWMKYKPGKALNFAKERGELIGRQPEPSPKISPPVQKELF